MKIINVNHSDSVGGAARAAHRIHTQLNQLGYDSSMWVNKSFTGSQTVKGPSTKFHKGISSIRPQVSKLLCKTLNTKNPIIHSPQILPSEWITKINSSEADVVNLHWVQGEMLSIGGISKIKKPMVWTLHDMWAFSGAEHYSDNGRWIQGYNRNNRPTYESGFDLNKWCWNRKKRLWKKPLQIVCPSNWLANCVRKSKLMKGWPVEVIPNTIDTDFWSPVPSEQARQLFQLPQDAPMLAFGAIGGESDPRKGFDLLKEALKHLHDAKSVKYLQIVVFGQSKPGPESDIGFPVHYVGHLFDDLSLKILYSAVDVMIIPSRQDNLPNTGLESLSCGTPVVAFDTCGISDIVSHKKSGYLAEAFNTEDLAKGIVWVLDNYRKFELSSQARIEAVEKFSPQVVIEKYVEIYKKVISDL